MPDGNNTIASRIREASDPGINRVGELFLNLGFVPRLVEENIEDHGSVIGEIDLVFEYEKHYFVIEVSTQRQERNEKILAWFQKWSDPHHMDLVRTRAGVRNTQKPFRIYVDFSRSSGSPGLHPIPPNLRDPSFDNGIIFEDDISYFTDVYSKVRIFARYDFLSYLGIKPSQMSLPIHGAVQFYMNEIYALSFVISADTLLKSTYVFRRRGFGSGYQRFLNFRRIRDIERKIQERRILSFPNSILINMERDVRVEPRKPPRECPASCVLEFPAEYCSSRVIDGQHRLMGIARLPEEMRETIYLQVIAFCRLELTREIKTFVEINNNQIRVDRNLVFNLIGDFEWPQDSKESFQKTSVLAARRLDQTGVLKVFFGAADEEREGKVYLATLVTALVGNNLIGGRYDFWGGNEFQELSSLFIRIKDPSTGFSVEWRTFLTSNRGVRIVLKLMYLLERNTAAGTVEMSNLQLVDSIRDIANDELLTELTTLFGLGGVRLAIDKIVEKLRQRFPQQLQDFTIDLRELRER